LNKIDESVNKGMALAAERNAQADGCVARQEDGPGRYSHQCCVHVIFSQCIQAIVVFVMHAADVSVHIVEIADAVNCEYF
jgi:hypothetical protein